MTGEGRISPDAMTTCLSALTRLRFLSIAFLQQTSSPYRTDQRPAPPAHTILPALTYLTLEGPHGYLEDLVGRFDASLVNSGRLAFHDRPTYGTPKVPQFIYRTKMFKSLGKVEMSFSPERVHASFCPLIGPANVFLSFPCSGLPAQLTLMERISAQWPPLFSPVEALRLYVFPEEKRWWEVIAPWLEFLRLFAAVWTLDLHWEGTVSHVAHILGELEGERAAEVLPSLRTIEFISSELVASESMHLLEPFLFARDESEHPVEVYADIIEDLDTE